MKKLSVLFLVLGLCLILGAGMVAAQDPHWSYEGDTGPEYWGSLSPDYAACSEGLEQSPVDIPASAPVNPADIQFSYQPTNLTIVNNGHAIQVNYDPGSSMTVEGKTYSLQQFHFHSLSEHTVGGQNDDMEMHLVHKSDDGENSVISALLVSGAENPAFAPVWDNMPAEEGDPQTISGVTVNVDDLLPAERTYYRYNGSLTTPPCTEGVKWFVMTEQVELSAEQLAAFREIHDGTNRPVQPFNDRVWYPEQPADLPDTGGSALPWEGVLLGFGVLSAAAGLYARRRGAA